jgi:hypothetical protein
MKANPVTTEREGVNFVVLEDAHATRWPLAAGLCKFRTAYPAHPAREPAST